MAHSSTKASWTLTGKSGSVSCGVTAPLFWTLVHAVLFVPSKRLFPQSYGSSVVKSHWPSKSNSLGVLSPFARIPGGEICCGPLNFCNSARMPLVYRSPVCGSSARWLYRGTDGNLLQKDLCHTPCLPGLLQPEPLSPRQATADQASTRDTPTIKGRSGSISRGGHCSFPSVLLCMRFCLSNSMKL